MDQTRRSTDHFVIGRVDFPTRRSWRALTNFDCDRSVPRILSYPARHGRLGTPPHRYSPQQPSTTNAPKVCFDDAWRTRRVHFSSTKVAGWMRKRTPNRPENPVHLEQCGVAVETKGHAGCPEPRSYLLPRTINVLPNERTMSFVTAAIHSYLDRYPYCRNATMMPEAKDRTVQREKNLLSAQLQQKS